MGKVALMGEEIEPVRKELDASWGRHADIEFVASMVSPSRGQAIGKWLESLRVRSEDRGRTAFEAATEAARISADELLDSIMADERLTDLFRMTMELAAKSGNEQKLNALGKALASGSLAKDDAEYDEALLLMRTIGQLEPADVRVLLGMGVRQVVRGVTSSQPVARPEESLFAPLAVWVQLEQLGLIEKTTTSRSSDGAQHYRITGYGKRVLAILEHASDKHGNS
jgi:hypothetical protein